MKPLKISRDLKQLNFRKSIKIRLKPIADGFRVYFDRYIDGKRSYTFTDYSITGTAAAYTADRRIIDQAALIRDERIIKDSMTQEEKQLDQVEIVFTQYIKAYKDDPKNIKKKATLGTYNSMLNYWEKFSLENGLQNLKIKNLKVKHFEDFMFYLSNNVKNSSANLYMSKLRKILNRLVEKGIIEKNISKGMKLKEKQAERVYLTIEELTRFKNNPIDDLEIMAAFFFQVNTGLRYSDMTALTFKKIEGNSVTIHQQKTEDLLKVDFNQTAIDIIDTQREKHGSDGKVFKISNWLADYNTALKKWAEIADVSKNLSSHVARHSAATILLTAGVDVFTVSKILGHKDIKTTQKYLHLVDGVKEAAMNKIQY